MHGGRPRANKKAGNQMNRRHTRAGNEIET